MRVDWRTALMAAAMLSSAMAGAAAPTAMHFVTKEYPPYAYVGSDGQPAGPMVELLSAVCARANWQCAVRVLPWRRAYGLIEAGEVDGVFPIVDSPEQRARYQLSPDVVPGRYVLLGKSCRAECIERAEPGSRTIATFGPSYASMTLQEVVAATPGTKAEIEPDQQIVMRKLLAGRYGVHGLALVNERVARSQLAGASSEGFLTVAVVKDLAYTYAFVPKQGSETRATSFSDALNELCRSGQVAAIFKPYGLPVSACQPAAGPRLPVHHPLPR